jgi:hypothetical protein
MRGRRRGAGSIPAFLRIFRNTDRQPPPWARPYSCFIPASRFLGPVAMSPARNFSPSILPGPIAPTPARPFS